MEKSTKRFLSLLLCLAMLLSFPIMVNAQQKSYEETFSGTYTRPEQARNVLVSGATITEWYGDRVNMGGHTYSVRQNQYGINKDGNMIDAKAGERYTIWLAQYGVASISFTAPSEGYYSFRSQDAGYEHSPEYLHLSVYSLRQNEYGENYYQLRDRQYGAYGNENEIRNTDAYIVMYLEADENITITADATHDYDSVYDLEVNDWNKDTCTHFWEYSGNEQEHPENCTVDFDQKCIYCGVSKRITDESHLRETVYEAIGNDRFKVKEYCPTCGKVYDEWEQTHHYVYQSNIEGCVTTCGYVCEGCGDIEDIWTETHHNYEYFSETANCVTTEGTRCTLCGDIDWMDTWENHRESDDYRRVKDGCNIRYQYYCLDCGKTTYEWTDESHTYGEPTIQTNGCDTIRKYVCSVCGKVEENTETNHKFDKITEDGCKRTGICMNCHNTVEWFEHGENTYYEDVREGCDIYDVERCRDCNEIISSYYLEADHEWQWFDERDEDEGIRTVGEKCSRCGQINWTETYPLSDYSTNKNFKYEDGGIIIADGKLQIADIDTPGKGYSYTFTAPESDTYYFYSVGNNDTYGIICSTKGAPLAYDDDNGTDSNFCVAYSFTAGKQYILQCRNYSEANTGDFFIAVAKEPLKYDYIDDNYEHIYRLVSDEQKPFENSRCTIISKTYQCIDCGKEYTDSFVNHYDWDWEFVQLTPQHDNVCGTYNYACGECGQLRYDEPLTCHSNDEQWNETNCVRTETCRRCANVADINYHRYDSSEAVTVEPGCTQEGYTYCVCKKCEKQVILSTTPALGHDWGAWKVTTTASCTKTGVETRVCANDASHTETRTIAKTAHTPAAAVRENVKAATCTAAGSYDSVVKCAICGAEISKTKQSIPATGHKYSAKVVKPTAITLGYTLHTCEKCGVNYKDSYKAPTGKQALKCKARTVAAQTVYWNKVKTATGYQVQISTKDGKKWSTYATLKAGVTNYTFKKLAAGNNYKFRVRFYIKAADGKNYFSPWSATLNSPTLPGGTAITKLTPAKKAFVAQWKKNAAVNGYQVQYSLKANFAGAKTITVKNPKLLKATAAKLYAGKYYFVRIRTYKTIAKANYFSTWSKAYKVKTK